MKKITAVFAVLGALVLGAAPAQAGNESELVTQSHRVESIVDSLSREFHIHFRHSRSYEQLRCNLNSIKAKAEHIHGLAHDCEASLSHIQHDLRELDSKAHHLHQIVDSIERGRYRGHVDHHTCHLHSLLDSLSRSIYAMERTAQEIAHHSHNRGHHDRYNDHYGHRGERSRPPHPAEIIGSIFRAIHGR